MLPPADRYERIERVARQAQRERECAGKQPGHPETDQRILAQTRLAVAKVDENPVLAQTCLDTIDRRALQNGGTLPRARAEWQPVIRRHPRPELRRTLLEESDEGQRLRGSHPFTGLVTPEKRARVLTA